VRALTNSSEHFYPPVVGFESNNIFELSLSYTAFGWPAISRFSPLTMNRVTPLQVDNSHWTADVTAL